MTGLNEAALFLGAAVTVVPVFKRLGLGSVLGYLAAGVIIGPSVLALIPDVEGALHFGEFGVVLLLFLVGLELEPKRLWDMRRIVFGAGAAQVAITSIVLGLAGLALGLSPITAGIAGFALSLSSTAIALQLLSERKQLGTQAGKTAFGILLFQDIAAIPMLALLPLLATTGAVAIADAGAHGAAHEGPGGWLGAARVAGVLVALVFGGRLVLRPLFRWIAATKSQELFTAAALMCVVGIALLMERAGLSMALGTFLAGVLLADTEFRHELEADIEPFKGLLLGLFFMAVGMAVNVSLIGDRPFAVAGLVIGLIAVKFAVLFVLGRVFGLGNGSSRILAIAGAQGGEFAFVLFRTAAPLGLLAADVNELLVVVVSVSMAVAPLGFVIGDLVKKIGGDAPEEKPAYDDTLKDESPVIIAGFGRVGQVVGRVLRAKKIRFTAMDASSQHVDFIKKFGNKIYYGDASRLELLRASQTDKARVFVLAIDDVEASMRVAETVIRHFPHVKIYARARNRQHAYRLLEMGVTNIFRETMGSSVEMTDGVLQALGVPAEETKRTLTKFRAFDEKLLAESFQHSKDMNKLTEIANKAFKDLEDLFEKDAQLESSGEPEPPRPLTPG